MRANLKNRRPLTEFHEDPKGLLRHLRKTGSPQVLTVNGRPGVVVQDAAAYQRLLDDLDDAQSVAGIRRGLKSIRRGKGKPFRQALEEMGR